jgi:CreA protein
MRPAYRRSGTTGSRFRWFPVPLVPGSGGGNDAPSPYARWLPKEGSMHRLPVVRFPCVRPGFAAVFLVAAGALLSPVQAADEPDLIFKKSTVFHWVTPNDKLGTYAVDDPEVEGVACHFTVPERGGFKGWIGVAEEVSDISLACRQTGPIRFKDKFSQGEEVFRQRRSLFFKKMQIVRGCDVKRNVLVYVVYSDRLIEGSPKNSTSTVPIMPWGADPPPKCADWLEK